MSRMNRRAASIALLSVSLPISGFAGRAEVEIHELEIEVGGVSVRALCTEGSREVVLMHGELSSAEGWRPVLEHLDGRVGACAYDRRGSGGSDPAPSRGWYEFLDELHDIHMALGFERGYLLVGHSLGGLYGRVYAADRPRDLSGLLLVDPSHEDMPGQLRTGMPEEEWEAWGRQRRRPNADGVIEEDVGERARRGRLPRIPVTVITASAREDRVGWDRRFVDEAAREVHRSILRGVESARHIPAPRSGHDVHEDEPRLVADEILRLVRATRR